MIKASILLAAAALSTAQDNEQAIRFVGCPIYRDTDNGRKSGCWLADDPATGLRYDVTAAPTKPDWNHAVLVEGKVATGAGDPCGGSVLEPARVSVLEAPCTRHMIKAEGYKGRRFALPERNVRPLYEERKKPEAPFTEGRFTIPFDFGSSFIVYQLSDYYMDATINYALDVQPARIEISGHAQSHAQPVSGAVMREDKDLAGERARIVQQALVMRGIDPARIKLVKGPSAPYVAAAFDGLAWPAERRVDVRIIPER